MSQTKAQLLDNIKDNVQLDAQKALRFADSDSSHYVAFRAPGTVSSSVTWTLPAADGSANYVLATDGSGTLSWIADPAGQWVTSGSNVYYTAGNVGIGDNSPSNPLSVTGASAFNGDVQFTGASYNVTWDKSDDSLEFADNAEARFGSGNDLKIYHNGSHSFIHQDGTGSCYILADTFRLNNEANSENIIAGNADGEVQLFFNGNEKLNTDTDGVNIAGTLHFADDANTYFGRAAADTLMITTAGSERLRVDAAGKVGIGTTSPQEELHVAAGSPQIRIQDTTNNFYAHIGSDDGGNLILDGDAGNGAGSSAVILKTDGSERARITVDGQFLVGSTDTDQGEWYFINAGSSGGDATNGDKGFQIRTDEGPTDLDVAGTDNWSLKLWNAAHSGSGVSDPQGTVTKLLLHGNTYNGWNAYGALGLDVQGGSGGKGDLFFATGSLSEKMRLNSSGRLLIGHTSSFDIYAHSKLQVSATDSNGSISITRWSNNSSSPYLNFGKSRGGIGVYTVVQSGDRLGQINFCGADGTDLASPAAGIAGYVDGTPGSNDMPGRLVFFTASDGGVAETERMRIDSAGMVGIKTVSPKATLHVKAHDNAWESGLLLEDNTGDDGWNLHPDSSDTSLMIGYNDDVPTALTSQSATPIMRLRSAGGICFGTDSAAANALDDYEEGTWTPSYTSTNATFGYATQQGRYTKIGNLVWVQAYINTNSVSSTGHSLVKVSGLPFQVDKRTAGSIRCNGFQGTSWDDFPSAFSFEHNQTFGELQKFTSGGNTDFTTSTMNNATSVYISGCYGI